MFLSDSAADVLCCLVTQRADVTCSARYAMTAIRCQDAVVVALESQATSVIAVPMAPLSDRKVATNIPVCTPFTIFTFWLPSYTRPQRV